MRGPNTKERKHPGSVDENGDGRQAQGQEVTMDDIVGEPANPGVKQVRKHRKVGD
jgi:hypothetical protein